MSSINAIKETLSTSKVKIALPLFLSPVQAGFPSPADDYIEKTISLDEHLVKHPTATYLARAKGQSMQNLGIFDGDLLVVDRALTPVHGDVVVAALNGEFTCKQLNLHKRQLVAANKNYPPIPINGDCELLVEGVVIHSIRYFR